MDLGVINSLWTADQIILTVLLIICSAILAIKSKPAPSTTSATSRGHAIFWFVWALVAIFLLLRGGNPIGVRTDSWSDANVVISGRNYARDGLLAHCGAAQHQIATPINPPDPFYLYTRYPVGSNWVNGILQTLGATSERLFRLAPAICSLASILIWRRIFRRFAGASGADWAAIILATSYGFLAYADSLQFHAYGFLTTATAVECYLMACSSPHRRLFWLLCSAVAIFLGAWFTWEYHLWIMLFIAAHSFLYPPPVRRRWLIVMAAPLIAALALQSAQRRGAQAAAPQATSQNAEPSGGFLDDFRRRTIGFDSALDTPAGVTLANYPLRLALNFFMFHGLPVLGALALLAMLLAASSGRLRESSEDLRLLVVLVIAGIGWWLVMLQHTSVHPHVMRHMTPAYAWGLFLVGKHCFAAVRDGSSAFVGRAASFVLAATLLFVHVEGATANVRLHVQPDWFDRRGRMDTGLGEGQLFSSLKTAIPDGAVILTNHARVPLMRYWSQRPVYRASGLRWPRDDTKTGRLEIDLAISHLCELYHEKLPQLYFAYNMMDSAENLYRYDVMFRFLLSGSVEYSEAGWARDRDKILMAAQSGKSSLTFCKIVFARPSLICFDLAPAVPLLRQESLQFGYPTQRQFGPMP